MRPAAELAPVEARAPRPGRPWRSPPGRGHTLTPRPGERSPQEGLFSTEPGSLDQSGRRQARWYRSGIQRQFRSSGERHQQRLLPWSLPNKTVSSFVSFHRGATQSGILFLVSIERGTSRRVYHRRPWLSDMSQLGGAPCRFFARPGCGTRRCRRTDARNATVGSDDYVRGAGCRAARPCDVSASFTGSVTTDPVERQLLRPWQRRRCLGRFDVRPRLAGCGQPLRDVPQHAGVRSE